jgi:hypothetical protein
LAFSYWTIKPWFLTEGKTCCYIHHTFLLGFPNWPVIYFIIIAPSIAINVQFGMRLRSLLVFSLTVKGSLIITKQWLFDFLKRSSKQEATTLAVTF